MLLFDRYTIQWSILSLVGISDEAVSTITMALKSNCSLQTLRWVSEEICWDYILCMVCYTICMQVKQDVKFFSPHCGLPWFLSNNLFQVLQLCNASGLIPRWFPSSNTIANALQYVSLDPHFVGDSSMFQLCNKSAMSMFIFIIW